MTGALGARGQAGNRVNQQPKEFELCRSRVAVGIILWKRSGAPMLKRLSSPLISFVGPLADELHGQLGELVGLGQYGDAGLREHLVLGKG